MTDPSEIEADVHFAALRILYKRASAHEEKLGATISELHHLAATVREASRILPNNVATQVQAQLGSAANTAAQQIIKIHTEANTKAVEATQAYETAVKFSFVRLAVVTVVGVGVAAAVFAGIAYVLLPGMVQNLQKEEARLIKNIDIMTKSGGKMVIESCTLPDKSTAPCVRTIESKENDAIKDSKGVPYRLLYVQTQ